MSTQNADILEPAGLTAGGAVPVEAHVVVHVRAEFRIQPDGWMTAATRSADSQSGIAETHVARAPAEIALNGESFLVEYEDDYVFLRHPIWSLAGSGSSVGEAEADLMREAIELREVLQSVASSDLATEALRLRDYLLRTA
jgi:hypothetical protein